MAEENYLGIKDKRFVEEESIEDEDKPEKKRQYALAWDEYQVLLKNKVKQGKTYPQAKREIAIESNMILKKKKENEEKEKREKEDKGYIDKTFKEKFEELKRESREKRQC